MHNPLPLLILALLLTLTFTSAQIAPPGPHPPAAAAKRQLANDPTGARAAFRAAAIDAKGRGKRAVKGAVDALNARGWGPGVRGPVGA